MRCESNLAPTAIPDTTTDVSPCTLSHNLARLADPDLARRVEQSTPRRVSLRLTAGGHAVVRLAGLPLCSDNPLAEAQRWSDDLALDDCDLVVVVGLGAGHHVRALTRRTELPLVVLEPSLELLRVTLGHQALADRGSLTIVDTPMALREHLAGRLRLQQRIRVVSWPPYLESFPALVLAARAAVQQAAGVAHITSSTLHVNLPHWIQHLLQNLPRCEGRVPASAFEGHLAGRPVVLVAAGPSLDRNVEQLRQVQDRATVIAVNTAMGALERAGVSVDLVVTVEMLDVSEQLSALRLNAGCPRLLDVMAHPALFQHTDAQIFPFISDIAYFAPLARRAGLGQAVVSGGSVSTTAFTLARRMKASPLILVGQDLAYTDGRVYAQGTIFEAMSARISEGTAQLDGLEAKQRVNSGLSRTGSTSRALEVTPVEGWGGGTVWTTSEFNYFRYALERWAVAMTPGHAINATEGGARIRGFVEQPLRDVLRQLPVTRPPARPCGARLTRAGIRRSLQIELDGAVGVLRQARACRAAGCTAAVLDDLARSIHGAPLTYAACWSTLEPMSRPGTGASPAELCGRVERDAAYLADSVLTALAL